MIRLVDAIDDFLETQGMSPTQIPYYDVAQRLARGDNEGAIDVLLTVIFPTGVSRQASLSVWIERDAYMQPILNDPRVQVAYAEFKREKAEHRELIRVFLENSSY